MSVEEVSSHLSIDQCVEPCTFLCVTAEVPEVPGCSPGPHGSSQHTGQGSGCYHQVPGLRPDRASTSFYRFLRTAPFSAGTAT